MLTDTTFWIDLLEEREQRRRGGATQFIESHRSHELRVSIVTWGELAEGFTNPHDLSQLLKHIRVLPLSQQLAWEASRIARELSAVGGRLGENDNWIAATARTWGLRLITRDAAFARVPRLNVVNY
ncbi:MAG TPA: type II toxin-antitoxin system VapC family toxin [Verrucomicrobiae bacterium]|jgi:predicted nucleic acid-binding protein